MSPVAPSRSARPAADHDGFFRLVQEAMNLHLQATAVPEDWKPILVEDYPKNALGEPDTSFDVILFRVKESLPGKTSNDGTRRPGGPMPHDSRPHPTKARYHLITSGWWEDCTVEFAIYAKSNAKANKLVNWFHRMMMGAAFGLQFFKTRGVPFFRYEGRGEDQELNKFGQEFYVRTLRYQVRLQFLQTYESKDLEQIHIDLHSASDESLATDLSLAITFPVDGYPQAAITS